MKPTKQHILDIQASCACLQARNKARKLTRAYDLILKPSGLKITQFSPLSVLLSGPLPISELAGTVDIDRTTLTRVLTPLQRSGYIATHGGQDARKHIVSLTQKGERAAREAYELWKEAQALYATAEITA